MLDKCHVIPRVITQHLSNTPSPHQTCTMTHASTHAWHGLPVKKYPNPTPPNWYSLAIHYTAATFFSILFETFTQPFTLGAPDPLIPRLISWGSHAKRNFHFWGQGQSAKSRAPKFKKSAKYCVFPIYTGQHIKKYFIFIFSCYHFYNSAL